MDLSDTMSVKEACAYLHVSSKTIYRWVDAGKLPAIKIGLQLFIKRDAVESIASGRGVYIDNLVQRIDNLEQRLAELERNVQSSSGPPTVHPPPTTRREQVKPSATHSGAIQPQGTITLPELAKIVDRNEATLKEHIKKYDEHPEKYPQFAHVKVPIGSSGQNRRYFTPEQVETWTAWIAANTKKSAGD